ncbi:hypothetical protein DFH11DRAFT_1137491 [Phellopilus nigrolimitatus]|nr:hypothetical protein DFH11DRAFT_1137491 [Phellopilus nigrolimitatus]
MPKEFDPSIYVKYASLKDPEKQLTRDVYVAHTQRTVTIHEPFPKATFHLLMLPRVGAPPLVPHNLKDLRTLLNAPEVTKCEALDLLRGMKEDAEEIVKMVEEDMIERTGFKWGVWVGFHGAPSMQHLHLHIISKDMLGKFTRPVQYNAFHPELGYFLHLDDVLEWFEAVESTYDRERKLPKEEYRQKRRTEGLECCYDDCLAILDSVPSLRAHLWQEFETKIMKPEKARLERNKKYTEMMAQMRKRRAEAEAHVEEELEGDANDDDDGY